MGGGGIIQQNVKALLGSAMDPSFYDQMNTGQKNACELINAKGIGSYTEADRSTLIGILSDLCRC